MKKQTNSWVIGQSYFVPTSIMPHLPPFVRPPVEELSAAAPVGAAAASLPPPGGRVSRKPPSLLDLSPNIPPPPPLPPEARVIAREPTLVEIELREKFEKLRAINQQISALKQRIAAHPKVLEWTRATFIPGTIAGDYESTSTYSKLEAMQAKLLELEDQASALQAVLCC